MPGNVVAISAGFVTHMGIVTAHGTVLTNSSRYGCVCEQSTKAFAAGRPLRMIGYLGNLEPAEVVRRAKSQIGRRYKLFSFNCEHFVRWAHGLRPESGQVWSAVFITMAVLIVATRWAR
jgi:hypothetical protein